MGLRSRVVQLTEEFSSHKDASRIMTADLERKLAFKEDEHKLALAHAEERTQRTERRLTEADDAGREWREQSRMLSAELATVRNESQKALESAKATAPVCTHENELSSMRARVEQLVKANAQLSQEKDELCNAKDALLVRNKNIETRHKSGDLVSPPILVSDRE